jgi:hypothetical protein
MNPANALNFAKHVTDRLPQPAKDRFAALVQDRDDAFALSRIAMDRVSDIRTAKADSERELRRLTQSRPVALRPEPYSRVTQALETAIKEHSAEMEKVQELHEARNYRWQRCGNLVSTIEHYLAAISSDTAIGLSTFALDKSPRGDGVKDLEACRQRILELQADVAATDAAPIPSSLAKQIARAQIDQLADRGRPNVFSLIEMRQGISWPLIPAYGPNAMSAIAHGHGIGAAAPAAGAPDTLAIYAWHNRAAVIESIEQLIDESADDEHALSDAERTERRIAALAALLKAEREEDHLIRIGKSKGLELQRRPDADPRAVLGLSDDLPSPDRDFTKATKALRSDVAA